MRSVHVENDIKSFKKKLSDFSFMENDIIAVSLFFT